MSKKPNKKDEAELTDDEILTPEKLIPADYNPRMMDDETKKGLAKSMQEFDDISGITWNKTTGNIVTGHHRWQNLLDLHGQDNLEFKPLSEDRMAIFTKEGVDTKFTLRVVEWEMAKEKAANVSANSHVLAGEFNYNLSNVLEDIRTEFSPELFAELRLEQLVNPFDVFAPGSGEVDNGSEEWGSDITRIKTLDPEDKEMPAQIFVVCKVADKERIMKAILNAVENVDGVTVR